MARFGKTLAGIRADAGFPSSYAFYHRNGGRRTFPFTYAYYAQIEAGRSLPRAEWLRLILSLLRVPPTAAAQRRLILDYVRDLVGHEETFEDLVAPLLKADDVGAAEKQALRRLISFQSFHMTPEQMRAVVSSPAIYWTFVLLTNNREPLTVAEMAELTGFSAKAVEAASKLLAARRLARRTAGGRWRSALANRYCIMPRNYPGHEADAAKLSEYYDGMLEKKGRDMFGLSIMLRTEQESAMDASRVFREAIEAASASFVQDKGRRTGMFLLQARVRKLLPW